VTTDRDALQAVPACLQIHLSISQQQDSPPSVTESDQPNRINLMIPVGKTKLDVLKQLEKPTDDVDFRWDHIFSHCAGTGKVPPAIQNLHRTAY
jgi:hypothetical protein